MDFLGMGWPEILVIVIVGIIVLGPERIPEYARKFGKYYRKFRKVTSGVTRDFKSAISLDDGDGESITDNLNSIRDSLQEDAEDLKRSLAVDIDDIDASIKETGKDLDASLNKATEDVNNTINGVEDIDSVEDIDAEPAQNPEIVDNQPSQEDIDRMMTMGM